MKTTILSDAKILVSELMKEVLADQFLLYTKARNYHWNVTGSAFYNLHGAFEKIYDELSEDIDKVAERIRALGYKSPGTLKEFLILSTLREEPGIYPNHIVMVQNIANDFETVLEKINSAVVKIQSEYKDEVSAGMFYELMEKYQKIVWMLRSLLEN
ncbi:MAG: DNA starvation/stationary phase protection protein [Bacteroidota bacterium]